MRYADAAHVDLGSFYARQPGLGRLYRIAGYAACIGVVWWVADPQRIAGLMIVTLVAWLMAWRREVGALWRTPLVAAIAMCAVIVTADKMDRPLVPRVTGNVQHARSDPQPRQIEFRFDLPGPPGSDALTPEVKP
ncbi:MAG: hypothetical protein AAB263_03535 [Planctomycetota bacterium]